MNKLGGIMTGVIKAHEVKYGHKYRLFPNKHRSHYLEVTPIAVKDNQIIFEHYDHVHGQLTKITNVDLNENVIKVA